MLQGNGLQGKILDRINQNIELILSVAEDQNAKMDEWSKIEREWIKSNIRNV